MTLSAGAVPGGRRAVGWGARWPWGSCSSSAWSWACCCCCWLRDVDHGLLPAVTGLVVYVSADLVLLHGLLEHRAALPWVAVVARCLAWPLIGVGVLRYSAVVDAALAGPAEPRRPTAGSSARTPGSPPRPPG